jgi:two-component system sensor histidine kinase KdpD
VRSSRLSLFLALVAAVVTATALGALLADVDGGSTGTLAVVAGVGFLVTVILGAVWGAGARRAPDEVVVERAETATDLAHELRNPLMSIKGLASTGVRMFDQMSEDERKEFFRLIDDEAGRVRTIADQAAEALSIDADRLVYDLRLEDIGPLVEQAAWNAPHGAHPMTVDSEPHVLARVDRRHLGSAVSNLVDNAAKYSPPDAPIDVLVRREDDDAVIEVGDRGPGIPLDRVDDVFRRFTRWRPAGYEETPGAGLGLFLSRSHVLAQGGRLDVVDRDDGGTILRISLPAGEG